MHCRWICFYLYFYVQTVTQIVVLKRCSFALHCHSLIIRGTFYFISDFQLRMPYIEMHSKKSSSDWIVRWGRIHTSPQLTLNRDRSMNEAHYNNHPQRILICYLLYCTSFVRPCSAALEVSKRTHWGSRTPAWEVSALARPSGSEGQLGCSCEHQQWPRSWWTTQALIGMIAWFRGVDYVYLTFIIWLRQLKLIWPWKGERHLG